MILPVKIFGVPGFRTFSFSLLVRNNVRGILVTVMVHMFLVIVLLLIKIQSLKQTNDVDISVEYVEPAIVPQQNIDYKLTPGEQSYLEKILSQEGNVSNRASNTSEKLDNELSTKNFVDEYRKELDATRSEEWRKEQEEINNRLQQPDYVPPVFDEKKEVEMDDYSGPSNISYEFLEAPFKRFKIYLPVPVYKCQGEGTVIVTIEVDQRGKVISAQCNLQQDYADKDCLLEVARTYALNTRFEGNSNAPGNQKAKIIYNFIPQ